MLKKILTITLLGIFFLIQASPVLAHTLKADGPIGAVIHISPEDDPIIGEPSDFFFEIKDKENRFKLEDCHCEALIVKDDKVIFSTTFAQHTGEPNLTNSSFTYTFPEKGVYRVMLNGMPLKPITFKTFSLTYDIRVSREKSTSTPPTQGKPANVLHYTILLTILATFLLIIFWGKLRKKRNV